MRPFTLLLICFLINTSLFSQIIYVAPNGTGDGTSWAAAASDLHTILENAETGDQIWVKTGTYTPTTCTICDETLRDIYFEISDGVQLYGGFAGTEMSLDERDWQAHPTILSGDIDGNNTLANNSYTILYTRSATAATLIDGFTIQDGNADDTNASSGSRKAGGAGWYNNGSLNGFFSNPSIRNCIFQNNHGIGYGGAVNNDGSFSGESSPLLENITFQNNTAGLNGGAIYSDASFGGESSLEMLNCTFENNTATEGNGGALFFTGADNGRCEQEVNNCQFLNNTALGSGGAIEHFGKTGIANGSYTNCHFEGNIGGRGGAIYSDGSFEGISNPTIQNTIFVNNEANTGDAGAIYNLGAENGESNPQIINCLFENNHSEFSGGAIFNNGISGISNPIITNCRFLENTTVNYGGAIYNQGKLGESSPQLTNCLFFKNTATSAGAVYNLGVEMGNSSPYITNCTFYGNEANVGGAIYNNASDEGYSTPIIRNCIIWGNIANFGHIFRNIEGTPDISHCLVDAADCEGMNSGIEGSVTCGEGILFNMNPEYIDAEGGDLHVAESSPTINAGDDAALQNVMVNMDLDNYPRFFNGTIDLGVYEWGAETIDVPQISQQPQDQSVCENDFVTIEVTATAQNILTYQWQKNETNIPGAVNPILTIGEAELADNASYRCLLTSIGGAAITSENAELIVYPNLEVSVAAMASATTICAGESVYFSTNVTNGGNNTTYQWYVNNNPFGASIPAFSSSNLNDGDVFHCVITSSENCVLDAVAMSNFITITLSDEAQFAAIDITASATTICDGELVEFEAMPTAGGADAAYQWQINGENVGENADEFSSNTLQNGDIVTCILTSSVECVEEPVVMSNELSITIENIVAPSVEIERTSDTLLCFGSPATFIATAENGGAAVSYQWQINGENIGDNNAEFTTQLLENEDIITCEISSSLLCAMPNAAISNEIIIELCTVNTNNIDPNIALTIFPNPAKNELFVEFSEAYFIERWELIDAQGRRLKREHINSNISDLAINTTAISAGVYVLKMKTSDFVVYHKVLIVK